MLGVGSPYGSKAALHHFSVDCSHTHRGLFAGVLLIVLTIISLIMFFVLANTPNSVNVSFLDFFILQSEPTNLPSLLCEQNQNPYLFVSIGIVFFCFRMQSFK